MFRYFQDRYSKERSKRLPKSSENVFRDANVFLQSRFYQQKDKPKNSLCITESSILSSEALSKNFSKNDKGDEITTRYYQKLNSEKYPLADKTVQKLNPDLMAHCFMDGDNKRQFQILKRKLHREVFLPSVDISKCKSKFKKGKTSNIKEKSRKRKSEDQSSTEESDSTSSRSSDSDSSEDSESTSSESGSTSSTSSSSSSSSSSNSEESDSDSSASAIAYVTSQQKCDKKGDAKLVPYFGDNDVLDVQVSKKKAARVKSCHVSEDLIIDTIETSALCSAKNLSKCLPFRQTQDETKQISIVPLKQELPKSTSCLQPLNELTQKIGLMESTPTCNKEVQSNIAIDLTDVESQTFRSVTSSELAESTGSLTTIENTLETLDKLHKDAKEVNTKLKTIMRISEGCDNLSRTKSEPPGQNLNHQSILSTKSLDNLTNLRLKSLENELMEMKCFINTTMGRFKQASWMPIPKDNPWELEKDIMDYQVGHEQSQSPFSDEAKMETDRKLFPCYSENFHKTSSEERNFIIPRRSPMSSTMFSKGILKRSPDNNTNSGFHFQSALAKSHGNNAFVECPKQSAEENSESEPENSTASDRSNNSNFLKDILHFLSNNWSELDGSLKDKLEEMTNIHCKEHKENNESSDGKDNSAFEMQSLDEKHLKTNSELIEQNKIDINAKDEAIYFAKNSKHQAEIRMNDFEDPLTGKLITNGRIFQMESNVRENHVVILEDNMCRLIKEINLLKNISKEKNEEPNTVDISLSGKRNLENKGSHQVWKVKHKSLLNSLPSGGSLRSKRLEKVVLNTPRSNRNEQPGGVLYTNLLRAETWTVRQVADWLKSRGLSSCSDSFRKAEIDGYHLMKLTKKDIRRLRLGLINSIKVINSLHKLKSDMILEMKLRSKLRRRR